MPGLAFLTSVRQEVNSIIMCLTFFYFRMWAHFTRLVGPILPLPDPQQRGEVSVAYLRHPRGEDRTEHNRPGHPWEPRGPV